MARVFEAKHDSQHDCALCGGPQKKGERLTYVTVHADCAYPQHSNSRKQLRRVSSAVVDSKRQSRI